MKRIKAVRTVLFGVRIKKEPKDDTSLKVVAEKKAHVLLSPQPLRGIIWCLNV